MTIIAVLELQSGLNVQQQEENCIKLNAKLQSDSPIQIRTVDDHIKKIRKR